MIRNVKHNNRDYIVVETTFHVEQEVTPITAPIYLRIDITKLSEKDKAIAYGRANRLLNHTITSRNKKPEPVSKPWWKTIFK